MTRYTDTIWLFPFGAGPDPTHPVEVFRNGISVWMGEEAKLVSVGEKRPLIALVLDPPTRDGDQVQATYVAKPGVGR